MKTGVREVVFVEKIQQGGRIRRKQGALLSGDGYCERQ